MSKEKSEIGILNLLIAVENVLGVYWNFYSLNRRLRRLAVLQVICATLVYTSFASFVSLVMYSFHLRYDGNIVLSIYTVIYTFFTTALVVANFFVSFQRSALFKLIVTNIDTVHKFCKVQSMYSKTYRTMSIKISVYCALLFASSLVIFLVLCVVTPPLPERYKWQAYLINALHACLLLLRDAQFYTELTIFNLLINIVTFALRQIRISLTSSVARIDGNYIDAESIKIECDKLSEEIELMVPVYNSLTVCSEKLKQCFGIQVVFSLFNLTLFYIFLSYFGVTTLMKMHALPEDEKSHRVVSAIQLLNFMGTIVAVLRAGQQAHNEMDDLLRSMVRLHVLLFTIPGAEVERLQRSVKNFHRQMVTKPIRIEILSQTPVQMTLLLQIVSTIVSYTIVSLQFNHVV